MALDVRASTGLLKMEGRVKKEWSEVLEQEELQLMQKLCVDWLRMGDKNTKFFHTSTLIRRRMNKMEMLDKDEGEWESDSAELKDLAIAYYKELFSSDRLAGGFHFRGFPCVDENTRAELIKEVSMKETKGA